MKSRREFINAARRRGGGVAARGGSPNEYCGSMKMTDAENVVRHEDRSP
jgi:hypothetical protein